MCGYHCSQCGKCQEKTASIAPGTCPVCKTVNDLGASKCASCGAPLVTHMAGPMAGPLAGFPGSTAGFAPA